MQPQVAAAWHRNAAAALVSVKPGIGYDFAYPTKVLAALACGAPVVFAGPGPAAADIAARPELGEAVPYDVAQVAAAMVRALRVNSEDTGADADDGGSRVNADEAQRTSARRQRADWVQQHRSLAATGAAAARAVLATSPGEPRKT